MGDVVSIVKVAALTPVGATCARNGPPDTPAPDEVSASTFAGAAFAKSGVPGATAFASDQGRSREKGKGGGGRTSKDCRREEGLGRSRANGEGGGGRTSKDCRRKTC